MMDNYPEMWDKISNKQCFTFEGNYCQKLSDECYEIIKKVTPRFDVNDLYVRDKRRWWAEACKQLGNNTFDFIENNLSGEERLLKTAKTEGWVK